MCKGEGCRADRLQRSEFAGSGLCVFSPGRSSPPIQWIGTQAGQLGHSGHPRGLQSRTGPTSCAGVGVPSPGDAWQMSALRRCRGHPDSHIPPSLVTQSPYSTGQPPLCCPYHSPLLGPANSRASHPLDALQGISAPVAYRNGSFTSAKSQRSFHFRKAPSTPQHPPCWQPWRLADSTPERHIKTQFIAVLNL